MTEKIPIELLLKYSRQEVGELKSEIGELKDIINQKNQEIKKLNKKLDKYKDLTKYLNPGLQVDRTMSHIYGTLNSVKNPHKVHRVKRQLRLYKQASKFYNAWYNGCKLLLSVLEEVRNIHIT